MDANKLNNLTIEEYVALEKATETKYEYHDGQVFAMAGGTIEHGLIAGNTYGELKFGFRKKQSDCIAINSEVKLHIQFSNKFLYPDVMVVCGGMERASKDSNSIINPSVIIEVLSKSTESYDRGDKFFAYRKINSLKEYILINQHKAEVDIYKRESDLWKISRIEGLDKQLEIPSLGLNIALKDVYENVIFKSKL